LKDSHLATGGDDGQIMIWDVCSGQLRHVLREHTSYVRTLAFDPTGRYLASNGYDNTIRLWTQIRVAC
jgi:WD40 repeat protein